MENITVNGCPCRAEMVSFPHSRLLFIAAEYGVLGCGYFNVAVADKVGEALAVVTGVSCFEDMLNAVVSAVSRAAADKGVACGMTGREALTVLGK